MLDAAGPMDAAGKQALQQTTQRGRAVETWLRRSSSQRNLAWLPIAAIEGSSLALPTNSPDETTSRIRAVTTAASRLAGPAEKLSMAGTRPKAWSAKKVTAAALTLGTSTPTVSPGSVRAANLRPSTRAPATSFM